MVILFAGRYTSEYNRNKIIIDGLQSIPKIQVLEYHFQKKKEFSLKKFQALAQNADIIYCPSFSHKFVTLIKRSCNKPVVFDPLISNYLTKVFDYKLVHKWSPRAYKNYLKDKLPFKAVDLLIADTEQHKNYYSKTFKIPLNKIQLLPVGVNTNEFAPELATNNDATFKVGFYGGFIPLQGVTHIIEAAELLRENKTIKFHLIGNGFEFNKIKDLVKQKALNNVVFENWVPYEQLSAAIGKFDVCLGIFGDTIKAPLVIPNKIFHYAAKGKPIITMESPAIKEVFKNKKDIILVQNTGAAIAQKIELLKNNKTLREEIGTQALNTINEKYNHKAIALQLLKIFKTLLS